MARSGGPIIHDKLFFFGSYEQRRQRSSVVVTSPVAPGALVPTPADEYQTHGRVDLQVSEKSMLAVRGNMVRWQQVTESGGLNLPGTGFNWTTPSIQHTRNSTQLSPTRPSTKSEARPRATAIIASLSTRSCKLTERGLVEGGDAGDANGFGVTPEDTYEVSDTVSLWRANHSIKMGGTFNSQRVTQRYLPNENGIYRFAGSPSTAPTPFLFQQGFALTPDAAFMNPRDYMLSGDVQDRLQGAAQSDTQRRKRYDIESSGIRLGTMRPPTRTTLTHGSASPGTRPAIRGGSSAAA